jgi:hypothetical protein
MTSGDVCHEGSGEDRGYGGKDAPAPSSHFSCSKMLPAGDVHLAGWDLEAARDNLSVLLGPVFYNFAQLDPSFTLYRQSESAKMRVGNYI